VSSLFSSPRVASGGGLLGFRSPRVARAASAARVLECAFFVVLVSWYIFEKVPVPVVYKKLAAARVGWGRGRKVSTCFICSK
jgi:hypothetical protein